MYFEVTWNIFKVLTQVVLNSDRSNCLHFQHPLQDQFGAIFLCLTLHLTETPAMFMSPSFLKT